MSSLKQLKLAQKALAQSEQVIKELEMLLEDIARVEKTMTNLTTDLEAINAKYRGERTTRQDVEYLSALLECAKRKLAWEKHLASLQKRTPVTLQKMARLIDDPQNPPPEQTRAAMLQALQTLQAAMERLQGVPRSK